MRVTWTYDLAMAASRDAGNRHAREAGREVWAVEDYNYAAKEFHRLYPLIGKPDRERGEI